MTSIKLIVTGASARAEVDGLLTSGMVGIPVTIACDGAWDGLTKAVVCRAGSIVKTILNVRGTATVAHECMVPNQTLFIGIEGRNADGTLVIPTVWARCGLICSGANAEADPSTDPTLPVWGQIQAMIGNLDDLETEAKNNLVAAINEALTKGGGEVDPEEVRRIVGEYLASNPPTVTETDPTVPEWAKQPTKPTYTAAEVGALPDTYTPPNQTAQQVGADPAGTAASAVSQHNTDATSHNDLRIALQELSDRINAALDSDDTTLDQMSEVVAYIKSNKSLIDAITTSKVSVADIVDNLTTNVSNKPLSAAQGVALKALIDEITVPDKLPNPYSLTFTGAVSETYDGSNAKTIEIPIGGGGEKEWTVLVDQELSAETPGSFSITGLNNFTEFYAEWDALQHGTDNTTDSGMYFWINDIQVSGNPSFCPVYAPSKTPVYGWTMAKYNGLRWLLAKSQGAKSKEKTMITSPMITQYYPSDITAPATKVYVGASGDYAAVSGHFRLWGR